MRRYLQTYGFKFLFLRSFFRVYGIGWIHKYHYWLKKYLQKYIKIASKKVNEEKGLEMSAKQIINSNVIWLCWLQGEKNAPDIVKRCIKSWRYYCPEKKIIVLDNNNIELYIDIPKHILEKWKTGKISNAHFSDILRTALLVQWGGYWVDATLLCTGKIPPIVEESTLFFYKEPLFTEKQTVCSSWFIKSEKDNEFLKVVLYSLYEYWKKERGIADYFVYHLLIASLIFDNKYNSIWNNIPYVCNNDPHILQMKLADVYSDREFLRICQMTFVHKLTYKLNSNVTFEENSFYRRIIE